MAFEPVQRRLQYVLEAYDKRPIKNVTLCYFGMANEVFIITTKEGKFVLKNCFKNNTEALIKNEVALIHHLNHHGCPTPHIIPTKEGRDYLLFDDEIYIMTAFCDDLTFNWETPIPQQAHKQSIRAMAHFHKATHSFEAPNPNNRRAFLDMDSYFEWLHQLKSSLNDERYAHNHSAMLKLIPQFEALAKQVKLACDGEDTSVLESCYVHGDMHCFNLFYDKDHHYTKVIDFDFVRQDHRLADIHWTSRILFYRMLNETFSHEELSSDSFTLPDLKLLEMLKNVWLTVIKQYRLVCPISKQELALAHLYAQAVPIYISQFYSVTNSDAECCDHVGWFEWELRESANKLPIFKQALNEVLNELG
jgi:Ser/Thr protein kinase RdoA (MazF antagonist)